MSDRKTPDSSRREGVPARPIRLADGGEWSLSRPTVRFYPRAVAGLDRLGRPAERVTVGAGFGFPPEIARLVDGLRRSCEAGPVSVQYESFFSLASCLLRRAHDVSDAKACELLSISAEDLPRLVREVMEVVSEADREPAPYPEELSTFD